MATYITMKVREIGAVFGTEYSDSITTNLDLLKVLFGGDLVSRASVEKNYVRCADLQVRMEEYLASGALKIDWLYSPQHIKVSREELDAVVPDHEYYDLMRVVDYYSYVLVCV